MAAGMKVMSLWMVALMVVCMAAVWPMGEGTISCGTVTQCLSQCLAYAQGKGGLTAGCCAGVKKLNSLANNTPDRQTACGCLKNIARSLKGANFGAISKVPADCGVNVPYKIDPNTDCSKVH